MGIKIEDKNNIPNHKKMLEELFSYKILVGIFSKEGSHLLMIAGANEFGADIKPKKGQFLAIPCSEKYKDKNPRDFDDLFVFHVKAKEDKDNGLYLVRNKGTSELEFAYWLAREVKIPERSYIRGGFDDRQPKIEQRAITLLKRVLMFKISPKEYHELLGEYTVGQIKDYMTKLKDPPNSPVTTKNKGSSNPLIDTGRLRSSITYKVVKA